VVSLLICHFNENIIKCIISICFVKSNSFLNNFDFKLIISDLQNLYITNFTKIVLRPNPEGFVFMSWKEREGGGMVGRKQ